MGFGLKGNFGFRCSLMALGLAAAVVIAPICLSAAAHAESDTSEDNRFTNSKRKPAFAGAPASDLSGASKVSTVTEIVAGKNVAPMLSASSADQMATLAARYETIVSSGGFTKVPSGSYKKGSKGKGVEALNRRLFQEGYLRKEGTEGEFAGIFTTATQDAVMRFQRNMGLNPSGKVDAATVAQLNVPAETRLRTIEANISRLQTYGQNLGNRYLVVNVPGQQLETVANGKVFARHNVIVGRPERPTPVVMTALSDVNFNPYWNAPASIVEKDIIPKILSGTNVLEDLNIKVFDGFGGPEIDPSTVDWSTADPARYHFREEPGPKSAMATAKINFPSPFGIYLHDTPEQQLFQSRTRYYSSGCVRVEKMPLLVQWVLNGQDGIGGPEISALAETLEQRDVKLVDPPQLRVTYLTAWPVGNTVAFRNDIYQLDGTGFVTGQPMPVGELSDDGQRFVLKPVPRKAAAVDAAEAEGFSIFGGSRSAGKKKQKPIFGDENDTQFATPAKKPPKPQVATDEGGQPIIDVQTSKKKPSAKKKNFAGLFDWESYRKEQKLGAKPDAKKAKPKKPSATASTISKPGAPTPVLKPSQKKPEVVAKGEGPVPASGAKPTPVIMPKPAMAACKPDGAGKMPANCKPVLKPAAATAAN